MEERALIRFLVQRNFDLDALSMVSRVAIGWELIITGVNSDNPIKTFIERSFAFELDVYHPMDDSFKLLYTADFYHFLRDGNAEEYRGYRATSPFFLSESGADSVPKLGIGIVYDTRSPLMNPLRALREFRLSQYGGLLGGPASYQEYLRPPQLRDH